MPKILDEEEAMRTIGAPNGVIALLDSKKDPSSKNVTKKDIEALADQWAEHGWIRAIIKLGKVPYEYEKTVTTTYAYQSLPRAVEVAISLNASHELACLTKVALRSASRQVLANILMVLKVSNELPPDESGSTQFVIKPFDVRSKSSVLISQIALELKKSIKEIGRELQKSVSVLPAKKKTIAPPKNPGKQVNLTPTQKRNILKMLDRAKRY